MKPKLFKSGQITIYLALSLLVWAYIWLRALMVQFSIDEVATFFMYIQSGQFIPPHAAVDANNHLLNSFLTRIFYSLFGSNPIILRLPNVLAALIYFSFIYKISTLFKSQSIKWMFIALSLGTHFIIEFFGYTRGYGLSMAFFSGAIYFLLVCARQVRSVYVAFTLLLLLLGMMANLNMILSGLSMVSMLFLVIILQRKNLQSKVIIQGIMLILLFSIPSFIFMAHHSLQLHEASAFYYGSSDGYFRVTIKSLASMVSDLPYPFAIYALLLAGGLTVLLIIKSFRKDINFDQLLPAWIYLILLGANWAGSMILYFIKDINFQEDRTAMHLLPLFYGFVLFSFDSFLKKSAPAWLIVLLPFILIPVHSFKHISFHKSVYGTRQQVPVEFYQFIQKEASQSKYPPIVSANQIKRQTWAFINYRSGGLLNPLTVKSFPHPDADFLINNIPLADSLKNIFELVLADQKTQTALYRNIALPDFKPFKTFALRNSINGKNEFYELLRISADSLIGKDIRVETEITVESHENPFQAVVVVEVFDKNRKQLAYEPIDLNQLHRLWDQSNNLFRHVFLIQDIPQASETILLYFWNKEKAPITISKACTTFKITE